MSLRAMVYPALPALSEGDQELPQPCLTCWVHKEPQKGQCM